MGNEKSTPAVFQEALKLFPEDERLIISEIYGRICGKNRDGFSEADLLEFGNAYLTETILKHLFFFMKSVMVDQPGEHQNDLLVTREEFLIALSLILKGTSEDRAVFVSFLCKGEKKSSLKASHLRKLSDDLLECYMKTSKLNKSSALLSWNLRPQEYNENFARALLHDLVYKESCTQANVKEVFPWASIHGLDAIEKWMSQSPIFIRMIRDIFHAFFPVSMRDTMQSIPLVPNVTGAKWSTMKTLLDLPGLMFINQNLKPDLRGEWRFLFASHLHGESFATMVSKIINKGPCVIIVKDTDEYVFGGFASQSWSHSSQFLGSSDCFLFSLTPIMDVYQSTGYNEHYMYLNHGQTTMPNGLGMGGQLEYFGLWLDYEFGIGHSKAKPLCTTYNSPQLSKQENFNIKKMEVWAIGPEPPKPDEEASPGSILDKDPEAKAMLSLLNKGPHSEGLREQDPMANTPEERHLHRK